MKLSITSSLAITAAFALVTAVGCSKKSTETASNTSADRSSSADRSTTGVLNSTDKDFVSKAARGGMAEVELGNLAQQRGSTDAIKDFGKKLVNDHTKLNNELKDIAARQSLTLPMDLSSEQRMTIDKLSKLSGAAFDREFWKDSVSEHRDDIAEFRKEVDKGENQALKDFAASSIPVLEEHLRIAEKQGM
jgi:putative membrane protein